MILILSVPESPVGAVYEIDPDEFDEFVLAAAEAGRIVQPYAMFPWWDRSVGQSCGNDACPWCGPNAS